MFSMTPATFSFTWRAMYAARWATRWAAGCGVVTITTSASGSRRARLSEMSPVPGGMSTTRMSGRSQKTSVTNCSSILCSIGPRQITGVLSSARSPTDITRTPWASGGTSRPSMITGPRWMPIIRGIENPQTSASISATRRPRRAMATARLAEIDDLPTPPLPEAMAKTRVRLNTAAGSGPGG